MRAIVFALLASLTISFSIGAQAQQERRVVIDMGDQVYRGESTIPLKRLIKRQYPNANLDRWKINRVRLVAKSRHGRARVRLAIGNWESRAERINGHPNDWNWQRPRSFDRVNLFNDARRNQSGRWQLKMRGNVKVRRIVVTAQRVRRGGGGDTIQVRCSSRNRAYNECKVNGRIQSVRIAQRHSNASCTRNVDWGFRRREIWVDNGCRATFNVRVQGRRALNDQDSEDFGEIIRDAIIGEIIDRLN